MSQNNKKYLWIINTFIIIVVLVLVSTVYLTLASATIHVPSTKDQFTTSTTVTVTATSTEAMVRGSILVKEYTETGDFPIGSTTSTADKAGGFVMITNNSSRNQVLVATTRLLSSNDRLFRLTDRVLVPAHGSVSAFAESDQTGNEYLIEAGRLTIPGLSPSLQEVIYAENKTPMSFDRLASSTITQENINEADAKLTDAIVLRAVQEINHELPESQNITKDQLAVKRIAINADPAIGTEAQTTTVTVTLEITALIIDPSDVRTYVGEKLKQELPDPTTFIEFIPSSLTYTITAIDAESGDAQISATLSAWVYSQNVPANLDTRQLAGKTIKEAYDYVLNQGIQGATITLFPSWLPSLPFLESKIHLVTE